MRGNRNLDLVWADDAFDRKKGTIKPEARGVVWSHDPIYCAASVYVHDYEYNIITTGWRGLTKQEREVVEDHLKSMGLRPWGKEK